MANLRTKILDFRGFDSSRILMLRDGNSHVHREFPAKFEKRILLGIINISREIGPAKPELTGVGPSAPMCTPARPHVPCAPARAYLHPLDNNAQRSSQLLGVLVRRLPLAA